MKPDTLMTHPLASSRPGGQDRSRLEALGLMTAGIVHDLGNMTQIVSSAIHLIRRHDAVREAESLQPVIEGALGALERTGNLVGLIIGFGRAGSDEAERVDLAPCLAGLERILKWAVAQGVTFRLNAPAEGLHVRCSRRAFENAMLNLIKNGSDAMPEGGAVCVDAALSTDHDGRPTVTVRIADNGHGMEPEVLARVFDPFFTTKSAGQGTGLGLTSVRGFVEGAGGRIDVQSRPGEGTTFYLHLPALT